MKILLFVACTLRARLKSGVPRVVAEIAKTLGQVVAVDFVKWDAIEGQLRYLDKADLAELFGDSDTPARPHRMCHRVQYCFGDTIDEPHRTWLLIPEITHHESDDRDASARAVSQAREYGIRTAAIFYDLIPLTNTNPTYQPLFKPHLQYVEELLRFDRIVPISATSARALESHYRNTLAREDVNAQSWSSKIVPILLPEINSEIPSGRQLVHNEKPVIVLVGTVEPRKRQVEALEAITRLQNDHTIPDAIETHVFGFLDPHVAPSFHRILKANPQIKYFGYADRDTIRSSYRQAMFSIFASNDEGYGLPIAESLALGVPCLTANFGAMAEVAQGGGYLTCDVNDATALTNAIRGLCNDPSARQRLRDEIARRQLRDWNMYCRELVEGFKRYDEETEVVASTIEAAIKEALVAGSDTAGDAAGHGVTATDVGPDIRFVSVERGPAADSSAPFRKPFTVCRVLDGLEKATTLGTAVVSHALRTDLLGLVAADMAQAWVDQARATGFPTMLTGEVVVDANQRALDAELAARTRRAIVVDKRRREFAGDEAMFRKALRHWRAALPRQEKTLAIVISTYNRTPFVEMDVRWLIDSLRALSADVQIVVVDNASSDDKVTRLSQFSGTENFSLIVNPQNTGMLGNLRICSTLAVARHVWIIGDDDFILPQQLKAVLEMLKEQSGLPLASVNFAVYHRERLRERDQVPKLLAEGQQVGKHVLPSGIYPVNLVATHHDNFFTAVYLLIFRSDLLAACLNHPFDGTPFEDLTECVPTTRWLRGNYRYVDCYWHAPVSITGNAHNSWSRHRPRWHGVIMPRAFELARYAGADSAVLHASRKFTPRFMMRPSRLPSARTSRVRSHLTSLGRPAACFARNSRYRKCGSWNVSRIAHR